LVDLTFLNQSVKLAGTQAILALEVPQAVLDALYILDQNDQVFTLARALDLPFHHCLSPISSHPSPTRSIAHSHYITTREQNNEASVKRET
jgi:hypothetical protein